MQNNIKKVAEDTNIFLKDFIKRQKKTDLISPLKSAVTVAIHVRKRHINGF